MKIIVGSRESRLAVIQSELVMEAIRRSHPEIALELVTMKTTGDRILDRTLDKIGGKGLFVRELDAALRDGRADLTVHSCKDLPMELPPDLPIAAFSRREDPCDALVLPAGAAALDTGRPIGCASARRRVQLQGLFPGVEVRPIRGNVLTRLQKLDAGEYGALVLAVSGLKRLGLESRISRRFCPPPGRGFWPSSAGRGWTSPSSAAFRTGRPPSAPWRSGPLSGSWAADAHPLWRLTPPSPGRLSPSPGCMWTTRSGQAGGPSRALRSRGNIWPGSWQKS